jgi:uncharacterized integral membrane protein
MKDFLFTLLAWLFTIPVIAGAIGFAIYNPDIVPVMVSPFRDAIPMPLYIPVLAAMAFGFLFGSLMTWAGMASLRRERRDYKKRVRALEKENDDLKTQAGKPATHNYTLIPSAFMDKNK